MPRLRKGDTVAVLNGKDRGKRGRILQVTSGGESAIVERINLMKHFERRSQANQAGGIIEREVPIRVDKLAIVCPRCDRPSRIGWQVSKDGKRRVCKRCRETLGG